MSYAFSQPEGLKVVVFGEPRDIDVLVGDAVHNLRATLDLLVVEAVGDKNATDVSFPFCASVDALEVMLKKRGVDRAPVGVQEYIRDLKPYHDGNSVLRALHDLDLQDKHRRLIPAAASITTPEIRVVTDSDGKPVGFESGELKLEMVPISKPSAVWVFPADGPLAGQPIVKALFSLYQDVSVIVDVISTLCRPPPVAP